MKTKRLVLALFAAGAACATSGAFAQNSTVIFGRADMGVVSVDNGDVRSTRADSGRYTESRWGIRGSEDLGGGLNAVYYLEGGISLDNGTQNQAGRLFGRGAYAGILSRSFGQLTLGRQYVPIFWPFLFGDDTGRLRLHTFSAVQTIQRANFVRLNAAAVPVTGAGSLDAIAGGIYSLGITSAFEDNMIIYRSPPMGGATIQLGYGFGTETASSNGIVKKDQRPIGVNVEWRPMKDLYLGAAFNQKKGQRTIGTAINEQEMTEYVVTGQYVFPGGFSIWGNYHPWELKSGPQKLEGDDFMIGLSYRMAGGMIWANYADKSVDNCSGCDSKGFGIGYQHHLSNRTELYVFYSSVRNDANSALGIGGVNPSAAGRDPSAFGFGIAHQF